MNKTAIYIIIIIFLLVTNIATIVTTVSLSKKEQEADETPPVIEQPRDRRVGFFHSQIGIRDEQIQSFNNYNTEFNIQASKLSERMEELRLKMVEEMALDEPDTSLLNDIASQFGHLHKEMKKLTMEYYFNLKSVSDEEQKERLNLMFRDMLNPEGAIYGRGRGGVGRGLRRGGGRIQRDLQ